MDARAGQPQQHVARCYLVTGQLLAAFDRADAETRQIIVSGRIHSRHFRRFAADQRAASDSAALGDPGDNPGRDTIVELAGRKIIKEEQRFCTLHDQIVDAHGDQIDADLVMPVMIDRQFDLGADPVIGGNQQWVRVTGGARIEKSAKAAQFRICTGPGGRFGQWSDRLDERVSSRNRDARLGIAVAVWGRVI